MARPLTPSDFLAMVQRTYSKELDALRFQEPKFRCFDCKRWVPRNELPLRCSECSGPDLRGKKVGYRKKLITQDAMVCRNCVDKHDHLKDMILNLQMDAYRHGLEKRATMKAMKNFADGRILNAQGDVVEVTN